MSQQKIIIAGVIVSNYSLQTLSIDFGYLCVQNGKITKKGSKDEFEKLKKEGNFSDYKLIILERNQFVMPGFVDCHTHAPQFPNIGLGLDRPLLEWLDKYTFPLEKQYGDVQFASEVYNKVVKRLVNNGTTTACYFGSIHLKGTLELVNSALKYGQRALIGKVSMNIKNDAGYYNETQNELNDVKIFVKNVLTLQNDLVLPVITPRFAISCDDELMSGLSTIARDYGCRIQSHISENLKEIEFVLDTNPSCKNYAEVYDKSKILNDKCIMAHAIHLTPEEITLFKQRGVSIAHCPASNTRLKSGLCPVRRYLEEGLIVGLGTDVSGGDNASILEAMRRTLDVSTHLELLGNEKQALDWKEALYLATLGGAKALSLDDKIGSFEVGKDFDALVIDVYATDGPIDNQPTILDKNSDEYIVGLVQKFVYLGDDRNIVKVFVKGNLVKDLSTE